MQRVNGKHSLRGMKEINVGTQKIFLRSLKYCLLLETEIVMESMCRIM